LYSYFLPQREAAGKGLSFGW